MWSLMDLLEAASILAFLAMLWNWLPYLGAML